MIPKTVGRYKVKSKIAQGGMATILRGYDPLVKRDVAIKILPREFLHDPTFRTRFEREAEIVASLEHPAIVPVYDYGEQDGQPYFILRYMTGGSLAERIRAKPLSVPEASRMISRLASALDHTHAQGVIHRDLKPGNILFDQNNEAYITDFGIAKIAEGGKSVTGQALTVGTPDYMSPEQARGEPLDGRSDVYALGIMLFEMLTGRLPYAADTPLAMAYKHVNEPLPHVLDSQPTLPSGCQAVVERAVAKRREDRFPTAGAMAEALAAVARESSTLPQDTLTLRARGKISKLKVQSLPKRDTTIPVRRRAAPSRAEPKAAQPQPAAPSRRRSTGIWLLSLSLLVLLGLAGAMAASMRLTATPTLEPTPKAVVAVETANVRAGPGTNYSVLATYPTGTEMEVKGRHWSRRWLAVVLPDAREGWIAVSAVNVSVDVDGLPEVEAPP
jgi:eukaryotic-like serine/threonine-protein kinase